MKPMGGRTWKYWPASGPVFFAGNRSTNLYSLLTLTTSELASRISGRGQLRFNGELSEALVPTFPARSRLSKIHGGLWRIDEFSAVTKEKNPLYPFRARSVIV